MNDFLRNLRSSHKKETPPQRKKMDTHYYPQQERRIVMDRRVVQPPQHTGKNMESQSSQKLSNQMEDILPQLLDNTTALMEQVEKMVTINEMMMESTIRKNNAVADFFDDLKGFLQNTDPGETPTPHKATASYASGTHYT